MSLGRPTDSAAACLSPLALRAELQPAAPPQLAPAATVPSLLSLLHARSSFTLSSARVQILAGADVDLFFLLSPLSPPSSDRQIDCGEFSVTLKNTAHNPSKIFSNFLNSHLLSPVTQKSFAQHSHIGDVRLEFALSYGGAHFYAYHKLFAVKRSISGTSVLTGERWTLSSTAESSWAAATSHALSVDPSPTPPQHAPSSIRPSLLIPNRLGINPPAKSKRSNRCTFLEFRPPLLLLQQPGLLFTIDLLNCLTTPILSGLTHGFNPGVESLPWQSIICANLQSALTEPDTVELLIKKEG